MTPRVSVVIPAFNNAAYITETMDSVLAQDYDDFEVIVADHSSSDSTATLLQRYASHPRVRLLRTAAGGGALRNWNRVSQAASGELLKLVCGDDLIAPTALTQQVAAFDAHPTAVLVAAQRDIIDHHGAAVVRSRGLAGLHGLVSGRVAARRAVRVGSNIFGEPACVLVDRSALERVGWWNSAFPYLIDQASYIAMMLEADIVALPVTLASFRISAGQWSVALARQQVSQAQGFHRALRAQQPTLLSDCDVRIGNARVVMMALVRRATYLWLRKRMGAASDR
jgi:glycosyltransferase involved in cell wall biosynthesis